MGQKWAKKVSTSLILRIPIYCSFGLSLLRAGLFETVFRCFNKKHLKNTSEKACLPKLQRRSWFIFFGYTKKMNKKVEQSGVEFAHRIRVTLNHFMDAFSLFEIIRDTIGMKQECA